MLQRLQVHSNDKSPEMDALMCQLSTTLHLLYHVKKAQVTLTQLYLHSTMLLTILVCFP